MILAQPLLVLCIVGIAATAFVRFRNVIIDRLLILACSASAVFFVIFPTSTTWIANHVGVGRGADLLLYLLTIILFSFSFLGYTRFLRQEREQTALIRYLAIQFASKPEVRLAGKGRPSQDVES